MNERPTITYGSGVVFLPAEYPSIELTDAEFRVLTALLGFIEHKDKFGGIDENGYLSIVNVNEHVLAGYVRKPPQRAAALLEKLADRGLLAFDLSPRGQGPFPEHDGVVSIALVNVQWLVDSSVKTLKKSQASS